MQPKFEIGKIIIYRPKGVLGNDYAIIDTIQSIYSYNTDGWQYQCQNHSPLDEEWITDQFTADNLKTVVSKLLPSFVQIQALAITSQAPEVKTLSNPEIIAMPQTKVYGIDTNGKTVYGTINKIELKKNSTNTAVVADYDIYPDDVREHRHCNLVALTIDQLATLAAQQRFEEIKQQELFLNVKLGY